MVTATAAKRRERGPALRVVEGNAERRDSPIPGIREKARAVMTALDCRAWGAARVLAIELAGQLDAIAGGPGRKAGT